MSTAPDYSETTRQHHADLIAALGSAADTLTAAERNTIMWLAGWDRPTMSSILGIFGKLRDT